MRKIVFISCLAILQGFSVNSFAQCTPDPGQNIFLVPDTATDFAPAFTYMPYEQILYIAVPTDTTVFTLPATIDTITLAGVTGLPASISFTPTPANGIFPGGTNACIQFTGTPTAGEIGTYPLTINALVTGNITLLGDTTLPVPLTGYVLKVLDSASYGIYHYESNCYFDVFQNAPNPFKDVTEIAFTSPGREEVSVQVFDVLGNVVFEKALYTDKGYNSVKFDASGMKPGVYIYRVTNGEMMFSRRMSLSGK